MKGYSDREFTTRTPNQSSLSIDMSHQRVSQSGQPYQMHQHDSQRLHINAPMMQSNTSHMSANIAQPPENEITQSLPVPEYKMGWIVGKRGSYINQLSKKSGAHITISESTSKEYGTVWKYVQITGTGRAVDRAKKLLHIRLERLEPRSESAKSDADYIREISAAAGVGNEHEDDEAGSLHHQEQVSSMTDDEYQHRKLESNTTNTSTPSRFVPPYNQP